MNAAIQRKLSTARRGVVLGLVLFVGIVVLVVGLAMIAKSKGLLLGSVDSKLRIKSRIAAETQATLQVAIAMEMASLLYGSDMSLPNIARQALPTGDGLEAKSTVEQTGMDGGHLPQAPITSGQYKGLTGLKLSYLVHATGYAPGGAKSQVDVELKIYQIPIFQFGVFYNGNLEISPGSNMNVAGPVHTNGSAFFRAPNGWDGAGNLTFQGPITATGSIYQWWMGINKIVYRVKPTGIDSFVPALNLLMTAANTGTVPSPVNNERNVKWGVDSMKLPIESSDPRQILMPAAASDPPGLARQKFANKASAASRWINDGTGGGRPSWITGSGAGKHRIFWERREKKWVRYWSFDVAALISSGNKDSIFYIADTFNYGKDKGMRDSQTIVAFRIINASKLPRNMSIATPNPVYIMGDFNVGPTVGCYDRRYASPAGGDYCNAMIASDAVTLLSPKWLNYKRGNGKGCDERKGNLDQGSENPLWTMDASSPERLTGVPSDTLPATDTCGKFLGNITVNAAIMTGNKAANLAGLPPNNYDNSVFEGYYEGGWHNTIRFLENLFDATVTFKGSFVCMWEANARGLIKTGKVLSGSYYGVPFRNWGFDPRFSNLSNMPPGTPFLATPPTTTWMEVR